MNYLAQDLCRTRERVYVLQGWILTRLRRRGLVCKCLRHRELKICLSLISRLTGDERQNNRKVRAMSCRKNRVVERVDPNGLVAARVRPMRYIILESVGTAASMHKSRLGRKVIQLVPKSLRWQLDEGHCCGGRRRLESKESLPPVSLIFRRSFRDV